jgi:hypothetical protein
VPASARLPTVSTPFRRSVAPRATDTAALSLRRSALASVSRPLSTDTVLAAELPVSRLLPVDVSVPAPRLAIALPPASA